MNKTCLHQHRRQLLMPVGGQACTDCYRIEGFLYWRGWDEAIVAMSHAQPIFDVALPAEKEQ